MTTTASGPREIATLLDDFEAILHEEYDALRVRNPAMIEDVIARKNVLVGELERYTQSLTAKPADWEAIKQRLERCAQANRVNGGAIDVNRGFVRGLLDVLRGKTPGERTYDAYGRLTDHEHRGRLAEI